MEIRAQLRNLHIAPRKVRLAANVIKGMGVEQADRELYHLVKRASDPLRKLLKSARANAEHNFHVTGVPLMVKEMRVDPGSVSKRFRPRAFGRAAPIRRRTSHVMLVLETGRGATATSQDVGPIVRQARQDAVRHERVSARPSPHDGQERSQKSRPNKPSKPSGFIRRVFNRKAI